jgi:hypothetical protein
VQFYLRELREDVERVVGRAIVDYANVIGVLHDVGDDLGDGCVVVVCRDEDAAAQRLELMLISLLVHSIKLAFEPEKCFIAVVIDSADEHYSCVFFFNFYFEGEFFDLGWIEQCEEFDVLRTFYFDLSAEHLAKGFSEHLYLANSGYYGEVGEVSFEYGMVGIEGGGGFKHLSLVGGSGDVEERSEEH